MADITIAHASDTHGSPAIVRAFGKSSADMLLLTGDIMQNKGRDLSTGRINKRVEKKYQQTWFRRQAKKWAQDIGSRPVITVRGNHDFISAAPWLKHYGVEVYEITDENPSIELFGKTWAGFRQIPYIDGEWAGERHDLSMDIKRAFDADPDILVTHVPPSGILDYSSEWGEHFGSSELTTKLTYTEHKVTHHFFGHVHECGGRVQEEMGIKFINGACTYKEHTV